MNRILITGGAGYLGSVLVPQLLRSGYRVVVVDSFMYGQTSLMDVAHDKSLHIIKCDVRDLRGYEHELVAADIVLPFAAIVGAKACQNDLSAFSIMASAIRFMLDRMRKDQRIVVPTTQSAYGVKPGQLCTEETPVAPISLYGRLKLQAEEMIMERENGASLRLATVYGASPRMRTDLLVNDLVQRAVCDKSVVIFEGHFKRAIVHIRDVAAAFLHAIQVFDRMKGGIYNVVGENYTKWEICEKIAYHVQGFAYLRSEIREDIDRRDYQVSDEKIRKTGFSPKLTLDNGIPELKRVYEMIGRRQFGNA